jgi:hypothetical protein
VRSFLFTGPGRSGAGLDGHVLDESAIRQGNRAMVKEASRQRPEWCDGSLLTSYRTDTRWWHEYLPYAEVRFLKGRVHFNDIGTSAPFPSAIVIVRPRNNIDTTRR